MDVSKYLHLIYSYSTHIIIYNFFCIEVPLVKDFLRTQKHIKKIILRKALGLNMTQHHHCTPPHTYKICQNWILFSSSSLKVQELLCLNGLSN